MPRLARAASRALPCSSRPPRRGGCGGSTEPEVPTTAAVERPRRCRSPPLGQTTQLTATVTDQHGDTIASPALTWTSSNERSGARDLDRAS